jgi:hypothetical protein
MAMSTDKKIKITLIKHPNNIFTVICDNNTIYSVAYSNLKTALSFCFDANKYYKGINCEGYIASFLANAVEPSSPESTISNGL